MEPKYYITVTYTDGSTDVYGFDEEEERDNVYTTWSAIMETEPNMCAITPNPEETINILTVRKISKGRK